MAKVYSSFKNSELNIFYIKLMPEAYITLIHSRFSLKEFSTAEYAYQDVMRLIYNNEAGQTTPFSEKCSR